MEETLEVMNFSNKTIEVVNLPYADSEASIVTNREKGKRFKTEGVERQ